MRSEYRDPSKWFKALPKSLSERSQNALVGFYRHRRQLLSERDEIS
jgi:hypothetical protein